MSVASRLRTWLFLSLAALCLGAAAPRLAAAEEQLVYWPLVTDGAEYRRVPYPHEAGSLVVLADTEIVVEARYAPVSYWPITREYLADLSKEPQLLQGSVEMLGPSGETTVATPDTYVLWHPAGVGVGPARLVRGQQARQLYEDYVAAARAAAEKERAYQRIVAEHQAAVEAWLKMAAERRLDLPPPPPELDLAAPEPFRAYATEPREAAIVSLPAGSYTMRMRDANGMIVPESERELVSLGPLDHAVGYVLRPEDRWTRPVVSFAPDEAIYTTGGTDLFFQPVPVIEYAARDYSRLFQPQSVETADPSQTLWVPRRGDGGTTGGAGLALWRDGVQMAELRLAPYRVAQIPDVARGYVIEEFEPREGATLEPDFHAMRIGRDALALDRISLLGGSGGEEVPGSGRQVRRLDLPAEPLLFLPCLLPLAVFLALRARGWTRRRGAASASGVYAPVRHSDPAPSRPLQPSPRSRAPRGRAASVKREEVG